MSTTDIKTLIAVNGVEVIILSYDDKNVKVNLNPWNLNTYCTHGRISKYHLLEVYKSVWIVYIMFAFYVFTSPF